jgi:hypothetical protein
MLSAPLGSVQAVGVESDRGEGCPGVGRCFCGNGDPAQKCSVAVIAGFADARKLGPVGQVFGLPPVLRIVAGRRDRAAEVKEPQDLVQAVVLLQIKCGCMGCEVVRLHGAAGRNSPLLGSSRGRVDRRDQAFGRSVPELEVGSPLNAAAAICWDQSLARVLP